MKIKETKSRLKTIQIKFENIQLINWLITDRPKSQEYGTRKNE